VQWGLKTGWEKNNSKYVQVVLVSYKYYLIYINN
jgi:hypothetical protein